MTKTDWRNDMKRILCAFLVLVVCLSVLAGAESTKPVNVNLNGKEVNCAWYGQPATIVDGRTMVPLRAIFEALGADVIWDGGTRTVFAAKDGDVVELTVGRAELVKNKAIVPVDVPALIMNDRTLVPARAVAEAFGVFVEWDAASRTVLLTSADTSSEISRTGKIESPMDEQLAYGKFYFGMTMQECWDAVGQDEGQKELLSNTDGINEIHIAYHNKESIELLFTDNYLFMVSVLSDGETEKVDFTDENVKIKLYGYDVSEQAYVSANGFLEAFSDFDIKKASEHCLSPNSVRRMGIADAEDALVYMGFDKESVTEMLVSESYSGSEDYRIFAEAIINPTYEIILMAFSECEYILGDLKGVSEKEAEAEFCFRIPDIKYVFDSASVLFEAAFTETLEQAFVNGELQLLEMSEAEIIATVSPMIEELLWQSYLACFENCPTTEIIPKEKLNVVLSDGEWKVRADSEYIKGILSSFNMFE